MQVNDLFMRAELVTVQGISRSRFPRSSPSSQHWMTFSAIFRAERFRMKFFVYRTVAADIPGFGDAGIEEISFVPTQWLRVPYVFLRGMKW